MRKIETNINDDPRTFWKFINEKRKSYSLPTRMCYGDTVSENNQDILELFANFISKVYSHGNHNQIHNFNFDTIIDISHYYIDVKDIIDGVINLPWKVSFGPDGIPAYLLKQCIFTLAKPLHTIFNLSLNSGTFPSIWKQSYLRPIHKSGPKENIENYRTVCIQSDIPKLLDYLVTKNLSWDCKNVIVNQQHGFSQGKSTCTNLVIYNNFILNSLENKVQVDSVYTDFSKAFDRVNHDILITKLERLGVSGSLLEWISSYLTGRSQCVKYGSSLSSSIRVTSGVPQGSHIGPLLFNLFVNDLASVIENSNFLMFADDLKVFKIIENPSDAALLQRDLDGLSRWCDANVLHLNLNKCYKITFARLNLPFSYPYKINNRVLQETNHVKDLGINLNNKLSYNIHIYETISKSLKMLGFIQRSGSNFSVDTLKLLYCSLVRSILEYCSIIWCPSYDIHINNIEAVQKRFLRYCAFKLGYLRDEYNYDDILVRLNINTLEHRRFEADMCFLHKILNGYIQCPDITNLIRFNANVRRNRNSDVFHVPFHHTNYGQNETLTRILRTANSIQNNVEFFGATTFSFKNSIKQL